MPILPTTAATGYKNTVVYTTNVLNKVLTAQAQTIQTKALTPLAAALYRLANVEALIAVNNAIEFSNQLVDLSGSVPTYNVVTNEYVPGVLDLTGNLAALNRDIIGGKIIKINVPDHWQAVQRTAGLYAEPNYIDLSGAFTSLTTNAFNDISGDNASYNSVIDLSGSNQASYNKPQTQLFIRVMNTSMAGSYNDPPSFNMITIMLPLPVAYPITSLTANYNTRFVTVAPGENCRIQYDPTPGNQAWVKLQSL